MIMNKINRLIMLLFVSVVAFPTLATGESKEKPVQHLRVDNVVSMEEAKKIFIDQTAAIKSKKKLGVAELQQIHIITYTLEKSIEYFVKNLTGERQQLAKEMAIIVENIHVHSENNRKEKTQQHLTKYFKLADQFIAVL